VKLIRSVVAFFLFTGIAGTAIAQQTVFVVRHAERADSGTSSGGMMAADPDLSEAGRARADSLARMLKDAGITAIYTTEFKRTQQTAAALAKALGIDTTTVPAKTPAPLIEGVKAARGNVLVVGHSNTVPEVLKALGVTAPIKIDDSEFDNLFVVTMGTPPTMVRLRFR
jgi:phosphohistidine phosphatase SixA